nr:hypothetical protein 10 [Legionellales bacterium]
MAIISDGTTEIDFGRADETVLPGLEKTTKVTAGGNIRSITAGERFKMRVIVRVTPAVYRSFIDLMNNGASNYYFTPTDTTQWDDLYPDITWPLNVDISGIDRDWDNRSYYYVSFNVESVSYV